LIRLIPSSSSSFGVYPMSDILADLTAQREAEVELLKAQSQSGEITAQTLEIVETLGFVVDPAKDIVIQFNTEFVVVRGRKVKDKNLHDIVLAHKDELGISSAQLSRPSSIQVRLGNDSRSLQGVEVKPGQQYLLSSQLDGKGSYNSSFSLWGGDLNDEDTETDLDYISPSFYASPRQGGYSDAWSPASPSRFDCTTLGTEKTKSKLLAENLKEDLDREVDYELFSPSKLLEEGVKVGSIVYTSTGSAYQLKRSSLGLYLQPVADDPNNKFSPSYMVPFEVNPDFPKIPANLIGAMLKLFFHVRDGLHGNSALQAEVMVSLVRYGPKYENWRALVPKQIVGAAYVDESSLQNSVDLITGEVVEVFPPNQSIHGGSCHSHLAMSPVFSSRDDRYELGVPGVHIVFGNMTRKGVVYNADPNKASNDEREKPIILAGRSAVPCACIILQKRRYLVNFQDIAEMPTGFQDYHPDIESLIKIGQPKPRTLPKPQAYGRRNYQAPYERSGIGGSPYQSWGQTTQGYQWSNERPLTSRSSLTSITESIRVSTELLIQKAEECTDLSQVQAVEEELSSLIEEMLEAQANLESLTEESTN
jgi:hypothetical protein